MRIRKIGIQSFRCGKTFSFFDGESKAMKDNPVLGSDSSYDSDDIELTELHCEFAMMDGQLCSIPYELYDLPDLREILSLETWNSSLTEEERFYLSAYLPDMDQQTFCLTMKELFDGSDLYFGNPLDVFFKRLKAGFYPRKVAHLREGLQFIKRKKYYHALRSYHDRMIQMFMDMRRMWDQREMSSGIEERISMWKKRRKQRPINLLDLNKFPKDDQQLGEEVSLNIKGINSAESERKNYTLPSLSANGMKFVAPNCRAKGVLKMKASGNGLVPNHNLKLTDCDISEQHRSVPKGVLKIVPKAPSVRLEQSELMPRGAYPTFPVKTHHLEISNFSSFPTYLRFPDPVGLYESSFLKQKVDGSRIYSTLGQPQCVLNQQESTMRTSHHSESSTSSIERQIFPSLDEISILGKQKLFAADIRRDPNEECEPPMNPMGVRRSTYGGESLWPNLQKGTEDFCRRSLESYPFGIQFYRREQHVGIMKEKHITAFPRIPEALTSAVDKPETLMTSSPEARRCESDISATKSDKPILIKSSAAEGFKNEHVLPLTYKRRKALHKVNSLDTGKTITSGAGLSSNQQQLGEGAKDAKKKFTGWKDMPFNKAP